MGDTYWVQLVHASRTRRRNDGTNEVFQGTGLDNRFPYASGDPNATETTDSPGLPLTLAYNYATANDSFQMWLMFKPLGHELNLRPAKEGELELVRFCGTSGNSELDARPRQCR